MFKIKGQKSKVIGKRARSRRSWLKGLAEEGERTGGEGYIKAKTIV
jgi:hypothetical protein